MKKIIFALSLCSLTSTIAFGQESNEPKIELLPKNPTKISFILNKPRADFNGRFGHADLRFSYGSKIGMEDRVVGFGPEIVKGDIGSAPYFGIGRKLNLIYWNIPFSESSEKARLELIQDLESIELPITQAQRNRIVAVVNDALENGYSKPYHVIRNNCVSTIAEIIAENTDISKGMLSFLPEQYANHVKKYSDKVTAYKGARTLREELFKKDDKELSRKLSKAEKEDVLALLREQSLDFRVAAYKRMDMRGIKLDKYLALESEKRKEPLELAIKNLPVITSVAPTLRSSEKVDSAEIENGTLVIRTKKTTAFAAGSKSPSPSTTFKTLKIELNDNMKDLKLKPTIVNDKRVLLVEDLEFPGENS